MAREFSLSGNTPCLYYVSSKCRTWEPAKSLIIFAPDTVASSREKLRRFGQESGWLEIAEADGAVLILPVAEKGWAQESPALVKDLYKTVWRDTISPDPRENLRNVWCWETLIFAVGYDEGAAFAGNCAIAHPNAFAQVAMVNGLPTDAAPHENTSDRWLLPDASPDWTPKNSEVPVAVWFMGKEPGPWKDIFVLPPKISTGSFGPDPETTAVIMEEFATRIRWKNSPDGTPARLKPKAQMDTDGEYIFHSLSHNGHDYEYYVRCPKSGAVPGLPVVICMHGHGEPAWMFAQKNGWPELQEECGEFLFVSPDSPEHTWLVERDEDSMALLVEALFRDYGIDKDRVYLTGFSNGSMATCWYATRHPELFAAIAPWNSPILSFEEELLHNGWQMPIFAINGDLDHKMDVPRRSYSILFDHFIRLNGGTPRPDTHFLGAAADDVRTAENYYTPDRGYSQGHRLTTWVFRCDGVDMVCYTSVKDMPHGAIHDESRATWDFLRHFRRMQGHRRVHYTD